MLARQAGLVLLSLYTRARAPCGICPGSRDWLHTVLCDGSEPGSARPHPQCQPICLCIDHLFAVALAADIPLLAVLVDMMHGKEI